MARAHGAGVVDHADLAGGRPAVNNLLVSGALAGLLAGTAMLAFAALGAAMSELPASHPLRLTAALFTDSGLAEAGPGALVAAGLLWAAVSVGLALLYAPLVPRDFPFVSAAVVGAAYALVAMAVVTSAVLPRVNPVMRAGMTDSGGAWVLAYAVFGVVLGLVPGLRRKLAVQVAARGPPRRQGEVRGMGAPVRPPLDVKSVPLFAAVVRPVQAFLRLEAASGIVLLTCAVAALVLRTRARPTCTGPSSARRWSSRRARSGPASPSRGWSTTG